MSVANPTLEQLSHNLCSLLSNHHQQELEPANPFEKKLFDRKGSRNGINEQLKLIHGSMSHINHLDPTSQSIHTHKKNNNVVEQKYNSHLINGTQKDQTFSQRRSFGKLSTLTGLSEMNPIRTSTDAIYSCHMSMIHDTEVSKLNNRTALSRLGSLVTQLGLMLGHFAETYPNQQQQLPVESMAERIEQMIQQVREKNTQMEFQQQHDSIYQYTSNVQDYVSHHLGADVLSNVSSNMADGADSQTMTVRVNGVTNKIAKSTRHTDDMLKNIAKRDYLARNKRGHSNGNHRKSQYSVQSQNNERSANIITQAEYTSKVKANQSIDNTAIVSQSNTNRPTTNNQPAELSQPKSVYESILFERSNRRTNRNAKK